MAKPNPCPHATIYNATNGRNDFTITITIDEDAWTAAEGDHDEIINVLNADPISVQAGLAAKGNCIKRESDGWSIHTQTNKSLYDTSIAKGDANKKTFHFTRYKKRPH